MPTFINVATDRCILCHSQLKNDEAVISDKIAVGKYSLQQSNLFNANRFESHRLRSLSWLD